MPDPTAEHSIDIASSMAKSGLWQQIADLGVGEAHIGEYFGAWAVHEDLFRAVVERFNGMNLVDHVRRHQTDVHFVAFGKPSEPAAKVLEPRAGYENANAAADRYGYQLIDGGTAVISLRGPLMKQASSFSGGSSTVRARQQIRSAINEPEITSILLRIDSPGGTVSGTKDLADEIAAAAAKKPVYAYVEDCCASAAYWIASQASKVFSNDMALVGSIGTYSVIEDASGMATQLGVKVHVIRAGEFKGTGVPGTEVTSKQLDEAQRLVNDLNAHFVQGVSGGRKMTLEKVQSIADGRVHVGEAAQKMGLTDGVQSLEATVAQLQQAATPSHNQQKRSKHMAGETSPETQAKAATHTELVAGCHGADATFILAQLQANATIGQAQSAWMIAQDGRLQAAVKERDAAKADLVKAQTERDDAKAALAVAQTKMPGHKAVPENVKAEDENTGNPVARWEEAVAKKVSGGMAKQKAVIAVAKEDPDLHAAYLTAFNDQHRKK